MTITPIFKDHSSYKSILTFDESIEGGPDNILDLCKEKSLKQCVFVSNNMHTFVTAWKACKKAGVQLIFGLEMWMCDDSSVHSEESLANNNKIIVFVKNSQGYKDILKIYNSCYTNPNNKYYIYRFDWKQLKSLWTDNLVLALPFFDSFLAKNLLTYKANIIPDFPMKPVLFKEIESNLPFAPLVNEVVDTYAAANNSLVYPIKTILYKKKEDAKAWQVYRSIDLRSNYFDPKMPFCCSDSFCWESYLEVAQ
jgi:DNA polymerase III alpha subunit